jgi:hypothetical protein
MEILSKALEMIQHNLMPAAGTMAVVLEMAMRIIPSEKPMSIMHVIADALKMIGKVCAAAGDLLDKVLPQKLK